jgi:quercetin dioxygenase-like cupin family protein
VNVDPGRAQVLDPNGPGLPLVDGEGTASALVGAGVGARMRSLNLIRLSEAARTREQRHDDEAVYFAIAGGGSVEDLEGGAWPLEEGATVHVAPGVRYAMRT